MELSIRSRGLNLTDELRELVTRRVQLALDTFEDRVENTLVYLMDLNGPKGGVDKLCQITVRASGIGPIPVREVGPTIGAAVNRAAHRVKYRLSEALKRVDTPSNESIRAA